MNTFTYILLVIILIGWLIRITDIIFLLWLKKPLWVHFYLKTQKLSKNQLAILKRNFSFYNKLSDTHKTYFEHRVAIFIQLKKFVGRENLIIDDEKKVRIAATAVILTFGMRKYKLPLIKYILVYPNAFYSNLNEQMHKGEFNPKINTLVFSWSDFVSGYADANDNINLGIHEFTHVIHLNSIKKKTNSSSLFINGYNELTTLLRNDDLKNKLEKSNYFRKYAFTNEFEFLAVIVENFIETPQEFKKEFPEVYQKLQQMFNFRFNGY